MSDSTSYWWKDALLYELYVDKFAGTFSGLTAKLDYLQKLGVTCLHILPHYPSPLVDDGYDISDYRATRPELGTLEDFKMLVRAAGDHGISILIDFVLNHTSSMHPWFREARASKTNERRDFYLWSETGAELSAAVNAFPEIKSSNWIYNDATNDYYFASFYPEQPDLNWDNPEVFREMTEHLDFWIDIGVKGFRLDAVSFLVKREGSVSQSLPETHAILKNIRAHIETKHPDVVLLAEAGLTIEEARAYFGDGDECQLVYHFPLRDATYLALKKNDRGIFEEVVQSSFSLPERCRWVSLVSNHDAIGFFSLGAVRDEMLDWLDPSRLHHFSHGRAMRPASSLADATVLRQLYDFLFSIPAMHVMYYGDEIGMQNESLPAGVKDVRRAVRGTFDWNEAYAQDSKPNSLLNFIRSHTVK